MECGLKNFGVYINLTLFTVISVDTKQALIYAGSLTKSNYISNEEASSIKNTLLYYMNTTNYYDYLDNFLDDIISGSKTRTKKETDDGSPSVISRSDKSSKNKTGRVILIIILSVLFGGGSLFGTGLGIYNCARKVNSISKNSYKNENTNNAHYVNTSGASGNSVPSVGGYNAGGNSVVDIAPAGIGLVDTALAGIVSVDIVLEGIMLVDIVLEGIVLVDVVEELN